MAQIDPLWAVCTELGPQGGSHEQLERFWRSGREDAAAALKHVETLGRTIDRTGEALDFGCGLGRVSQPLADTFAHCVGVDASPTMLELARRFNRTPNRLTFTLNARADLAAFPKDHYAFVYSTRVLQHIPRRYALGYVAELVRILNPDDGVLAFHAHEVEGGWVFSGLSALQRLRQRASLLRARVRRAIAGFQGREGVPLPARMHMFPLPAAVLRPVIEAHGGRILDIAPMGFDPMRIRPVLQPLADRWHCGLQPMEYVVVKGAKSRRGVTHDMDRERVTRERRTPSHSGGRGRLQSAATSSFSRRVGSSAFPRLVPDARAAASQRLLGDL
jgi:SAM-dependent methyltransferase